MVIVHAQRRAVFEVAVVSCVFAKSGIEVVVPPVSAHFVANANPNRFNFRQELRVNESKMDDSEPKPILSRPRFLLPHSTLAHSHRE